MLLLRLRRRAIAVPVLLVLPYVVGILWTLAHPLVSIITGELKCRGNYVDENGLDVHRHRVPGYPLERRLRLRLRLPPPSSTNSDDQSVRGGMMHGRGMCDVVRSAKLAGAMSPSVECLRHDATTGSVAVAFDVVRVAPPLGPAIDPAEAVVLVVGGGGGEGGDWYDDSDVNASILHLIGRLGNGRECPWLTKAVFVVSPVVVMGNNVTSYSSTTTSLGSVVDAFVGAYSGSGDVGDDGVAPRVRPLPADFTFPAIRTLLVLSDVVDVETPSSLSSVISDGNDGLTRTEVRILPHGDGGALPNLDLVFATYMSFQSHPAGSSYDRSKSIYYGESEFRAHPFGAALEKRMGGALRRAGEFVGLSSKQMAAVEGYARDLAGMLGFVAATIVGPRQPHASALGRGIDALTIEVRIPSAASGVPPSSSSIHPHGADLARVAEHLLRSVSNLHERLHHSVAQYALPSPSKFVSHGEYVYPAILVALPMVVRAADLALGGDLRRFRFWHAGRVVGSAFAATVVVGAWAAMFADGSGNGDAGDSASSDWWIARALFAASYLLVVAAARCGRRAGNSGGAIKMAAPLEGADLDEDDDARRRRRSAEEEEERRGSLRFVACLLGIYLHAPLLLANYSLGFPSSVIWTPPLAMLVLPASGREFVSRSGALSALAALVKGLILIATSPPVLLVPRIFQWCSPYVICVYTPLHLLLAALWLA